MVSFDISIHQNGAAGSGIGVSGAASFDLLKPCSQD
jgi:hypothetical protein